MHENKESFKLHFDTRSEDKSRHGPTSRGASAAQGAFCLMHALSTHRSIDVGPHHRPTPVNSHTTAQRQSTATPPPNANQQPHHRPTPVNSHTNAQRQSTATPLDSAPVNSHTTAQRQSTATPPPSASQQPHHQTQRQSTATPPDSAPVNGHNVHTEPLQSKLR